VIAPWFLGRMAALDFESSDKHPETARIVTCALILVGGGLPQDTRTWLLSPGIPMQPEAIKVHKITDEYAAAHGRPAAEGVHEIAQAVAHVVTAGVPLVGHNLGGYDLNLLNAECQRHLGDTLEGIVRQPLTRVIDTMVLDRHVAPFRRRVSETQGPYQMRTSAETYGLPWNEAEAHGAEYDALQSARVAYRMGVIAHTPRAERPEWVQRLRNRRGPYERFNDLADLTVEELHARQIGWARQQAEDLRQYFIGQGEHDKARSVRLEWPLVPAAVGEPDTEGADA
jgi:DNA polymerase-3 subunit epsilon